MSTTMKTTRLDRILQAAVNSLVHGHHAPHCFRSHVLGKGYVNDGSAEYDRADYLRQLEHSAQSEVDNMGWAPGYAEPGYEQPAHGVLTANWNTLPKDLDRILERAGYAIEWSDEWSTCDDCHKLVRTEANSYGWQPSYVMYNDCEIICKSCALENIADYETHLLNDAHRADTFRVDWITRGFERFNADHYENGFHPGQNDKPADIVKALPSGYDFIFAIPSVGQFDIAFDVWIRPENYDDNE